LNAAANALMGTPPTGSGLPIASVSAALTAPDGFDSDGRRPRASK
jgi:hypothetical protein